MNLTKKVVFSGIQPTGVVHLGNYFGAIRNWLKLQGDTERHCIFSIVDLHSLTTPYEPMKLRADTKLMLSTLLACGIDPQKCILYKQSSVLEHTLLSWVLTCETSINKLKHFPQFKEKSNIKNVSTSALLLYPVLQTADILLFKSNEVPVGADQIAHLQLTRDFVERFNGRYKDIFPMPVPLINEQEGGKVYSLRDPTAKMSKSDVDKRSRIEFTDDDDTIVDKVKKALTDSTSAVTYEPKKRPGVSNLIDIYRLFTGENVEKIVSDASSLTTAQFKLRLADIVIETVRPIRQKIEQFESNQDFLEKTLKEGGERASIIARETMREVKSAIGIGE